MSWVVDKSTQHASEKPDFETASSGILTGELTHLQNKEHSGAFLHGPAFCLFH